MNFQITRIFLTAFGGGVLTLGLEIVAGRILTPFFGSSLHQWAALIGIVLLAYVLGYETSTRINRWGPWLPFALGGIYALSLPFWLYLFLESLLQLPLATASIGGACLATGIPSALWASVLPFLQNQKEIQKPSRVLAWSTAGNLAGVWGVAFLGVPEIGTRMTLISLGGLSLILAVLWINPIQPITRVVWMILMGVSLPALRPLTQENPQKWAARHLNPGSIASSWSESEITLKTQDSAYQQIIIGSGQIAQKPRRILMLNGNIQFIWGKDEKLTSAGQRYEYYNYATAAAYWTRQGPAKSLLALGVAGGLVPWQIRQFLPQLEVTGFELDPTLTQLATTLLPLQYLSPIDLQIGDARFLLRKTEKKYDYIFLDCFVSGFVPFHLTTQEFFDLARSRLKPGGILAANFHTIFAQSGLLTRLEKTMASVFESVVSLDLPSGITFTLARAEPLSPSLAPSLSEEEQFLRAADLSPPELKRYSYEAMRIMRKIEPPLGSATSLLTDDLNPTEQLLYDTRKRVWVNDIL